MVETFATACAGVGDRWGNIQEVLVWLVERMAWLDRKVADAEAEGWRNEDDDEDLDDIWGTIQPAELAAVVEEAMTTMGASTIGAGVTASEVADDLREQVVRPQLFEQAQELRR